MTARSFARSQRSFRSSAATRWFITTTSAGYVAGRFARYRSAASGLERPLQYTRSTEEKENSMAKRRVQLYERRDKDWGWRRLSANNNITATSGEGYSTPIGAERAAKRENPGLPVVKKQSKKRG
jgi:hypothetical protein